MANARVLITGASGLLGRKVLAYFQNESNNKWTCLGLCYSRNKNENLKSCDIRNFDQINSIIDEFKPNVIIHCAAERKVDAVDDNFFEVVKLNIDATKNLAEVAAKLGILFVYISTDYIFDGYNPPYKIDAHPNPLNRYGVTKYEGEKVTLNASSNHCVVRVPILCSNDLESLKESAISVLFEKVKNIDATCTMDHYQKRYPIDCYDVARFLDILVQKRLQGENEIRGIFHCAGSERFTKYEMACLMADLFNLPKTHIIADSCPSLEISQLRPTDAQLDTTYSFEKLDNFKTIVDFKTCIKRALEPFAK